MAQLPKSGAGSISVFCPLALSIGRHRHRHGSIGPSSACTRTLPRCSLPYLSGPSSSGRRRLDVEA